MISSSCENIHQIPSLKKLNYLTDMDQLQHGHRISVSRRRIFNFSHSVQSLNFDTSKVIKVFTVTKDSSIFLNNYDDWVADFCAPMQDLKMQKYKK